jgi:hypothetical protein
MGPIETFQVMLTPREFERAAAKLKQMNLGRDFLREGTLPEIEGTVLSYTVSGMATGMSVMHFTVRKKLPLTSVNAMRCRVWKLIGGMGDDEA